MRHGPIAKKFLALVSTALALTGTLLAQSRAMSVEEAMAIPSPAADERIQYGSDDPLQFGDLRLPKGPGPFPVAVVIHGGCWLSEYGLGYIGGLSAALTEAGIATWTVEYRRVGDPGGGWPNTFLDVALGADHLRSLAENHRLDLNRVIAVGHSAGGQLALWLAARPKIPAESPLYTPDPIAIAGVLALAPAAELEELHQKGVCGNVVDRLMGGSPGQFPDRYAVASPSRMSPLGVPQELIGGALDENWLAVGESYARKALAAGDPARWEVAAQSGHFEMVDPRSDVWPMVLRAARSLLASAPEAELRIAELGDFELESGETLRDCKIGYRTFGKLNRDRSNAVLVPTWFGGKSADLQGFVGPGGLFDPSQHFVILVDALGNGVSSSPSNSAAQPGPSFPRFTIRDMVRTQHALATKTLGLSRLRAVAGISMGGMQAYEWAVTYPDFMDKVAPIVGTPRQTSYDLLVWNAELGILDSAEECGCDPKEAMRRVAAIQGMVLQTPAYRVRETDRAGFSKFLDQLQDQLSTLDPLDYAAQLRAMIGHDVSRDLGGELERAAARVRAEFLTVVANQDHAVNPTPAIRFADLLGSAAVRLDSDCGHLAPACQSERLSGVVRRFLERTRAGR